MKYLLSGCDENIANWTSEKFGIRCMDYNMALGIVDDGRVVGSVLFSAYNGHDVEISYFGPNTMTLGLVKQIAKIAVNHLGVSRITARTTRNNKTMTRGVKKIGFEYEGIRHNAYGEYDAVMYGLYGDKLAKLAGKAVH